ncbi:hypothetical protein DPMN_043086 [Dreissena polymorpha]|uniref:Uncharacterized protein n=1 Tax=Dreissena polymorpha TaxID=45954 RepID=A0A9D4CZT0_DREPO|nr:hypothetical protein DPMN_043086 [Dreissena polymorpha]
MECRNVVSIRGRSRETTSVIIQSDSGSESKSTETSSHRLFTESVALKKSLIDFMSVKKGGTSTFARHKDEGLAKRHGDIKRASQIKLTEVLHKGHRQAEERHTMFQQMPTFPQQQQQQQQLVAPIQPIQPQPQSYLPISSNWQNPPRMVSQSHQWQPPP